MNVDFYHHTLGAEEKQAVSDTLDNLFIALGPKVEEFEEKFADYLGIPNVVATSSCSMSLLLALEALGIGEGDEVITTPMTFVATSNAVLQSGADLKFADIDPDSGLIDPQEIEKQITSKTEAIIPVHLYGQMADMRAVREIADAHDLCVIEDSAQAIEATRDGVSVGELGDMATFSFYATKPMTCGNGGAIAVHNDELAEKLSELRLHGVTKSAADRHGDEYEHWDMDKLGYKAPMTDIDASILMPQLNRLEKQRKQRKDLVNLYREKLGDHPDIDLVKRKGEPSYHLFTVRVDNRDQILSELDEYNIDCAVNYRAVHTLEYYREELGYRPDDFPKARMFGRRTISLPLYPDLEREKVEYVCDSLKEILQ